MQRLAGWLGDAEVKQVVREMRTRQKFRGEIPDAARIRPAVIFHARDRVLEEPFADGQRKREIEVMLRRRSFEPTHSGAEIIAKGLLDFVGGETGAVFFR